MKTANPLFRLFWIPLCAGAFAAAPASSQDLVQDTLAVRILLDQNGLTATPVSQVAEIDAKLSRVSALRLAGMKITALPSQIGSLSALKYLVLSENLLDSLPAAIWNLASLVELDLGGNRIAALDPRVSQLQSLLLLGLRGNGLASLPAPLFALPQLETLILSGNALDTLPEAVAELAFLRYLDASGNVLRTVPFTIAAMDRLDTLDLSSNSMTSLPDLIRQLPAATRVRLGANQLCDLGPELQAWATAKDPDWKAGQTCGAPVRPRANRAAGPGMRAFADAGRVRLDWVGTAAAAGMEVVLRDAKGRAIVNAAVAAGATGFSFERAALPAGFMWAELRGGGRVLASAPVLP